MPGMMDTVLNLGLNDESVEGLAKQTDDERFAFDSYRRFIAMYSRIVLDLDDVRWELGRFGKLNVRHGKGSRRRGPKPRLVPLINGADRNLRWFIEDVWGQFDDDHERPGAPLFPSERKCQDGSCSRATADVFRRSLAEAAGRHLPAWSGKLTPHVLRRYCASQLYQAGMTLFAIQELLGRSWTGTTARYVHVHATHVEDAWVAGQQRAADRWKGLAP